MPQTIHEPAREIEVYGVYEVAVLGGGPAGIAAAVAAARRGRKVLLVERYGFLGGMGTAAGVTNFCGLHANVRGEHRQVVQGVADDLLARIDRLGGLNEPHLVLGRILAQAYDTAAYKRAADDLLLGAGVDILFHALAAGCVLDEQRISALLIETKSGRRAVLADVFIDASGDGDLAAWAGAPYELGDGCGSMLYPTLMFRLNGVNPDAAGDAWRTIPERMAEAETRGRKFPRKGAIVRPQRNSIEWRVNVTQLRNPDGSALDGTDAAALSAGEIEGRRQAEQFFAFMKDEVPGFENSYIVDVPPQIGIRETRRITGVYQLTGDDVTSCADFDDTIGINGWPLEQHVAGDVKWGWAAEGSRGFNHLPYRMLIPQNVENLLVAGRCASMTHEGQSAARVSGACFAMGEAAGAAAHLAITGNQRSPAGISIAALQATLAEGGAYLGQDT